MYNLNSLIPRVRTLSVAALLLSASACSFNEVEPVVDPNSANVNPDNIILNPTPGQISALATGVEASLRLGHSGRGQYNAITGTFGREIYILALNDNRYYTELLGTNAALDNAGPYNDLYVGFSRVRRAAINFRGSAETASDAVLSAQQKQAIRGYTRTVEALAMLHLANLQYDNGIRLDVNDIYKPSKFTQNYKAVLDDINTRLTTAATELAAGGTSFGFTLPSGYVAATSTAVGFDTPTKYLKFNRALAARVNLYRKDYVAAQTALTASFYDPAGDLKTGPKIVFNAGAANDIGNPYAQILNSNVSTLVTAQKDFVADLDRLYPGDARRSKVSLRNNPRTLGGLTGSYDPNLFAQGTPLDIIRNEELILIAAEINVAKTSPDFATAVDLINVIYEKAGKVKVRNPVTNIDEFLKYTGPVNKTALENELLNQRRFSLFYEGHRWVDLRRFGADGSRGRLDELPKDLATHKIYDRMPRPVAEVQYDQANP